MKIVHIVPCAPYNDNWGYQDNLLPKYHKKIGHEVTTITTNTIHKDGKIVEINPNDYFLEDGVRVIRLKKKKYYSNFLTNINSKLPVYSYLKQIKPDFIFFHGLISTTIFDVIKYKKYINHNCIIVQDNHLDYNISVLMMKNFKVKLVRIYYIFINYLSKKYISRFYGVTPWRVKFAIECFKIPKKKIDTLIMGADDEKIDFNNKESIRNNIREKYNITNEEFLIVTGGKIDKKKNIDVLMRAVEKIKKVKLLIFGEILEDTLKDFNKLLKGNKEKLIFIGWIDSSSIYDYFFASDLVVFPGQHSVLWEQACASKVPCLFKKWEGMEHVNNGGNSAFIENVTVDNLKKEIEQLVFTDKYYDMKKIAESEKTDIYLYSNIAKKSLESVEKNEFEGNNKK